MSDIQQGFKPAEFHGVFLEQNGPFYVKKTDACWLVGLSIEEHHANYLAIAHGGVISTLSDVALSLQPFYSEKPNPPVTTTSLTINFIAPAKIGDWLVAETQIDHMGKRTAHVSGKIFRDDVILATMSGVFNIFRGK